MPNFAVIVLNCSVAREKSRFGSVYYGRAHPCVLVMILCRNLAVGLEIRLKIGQKQIAVGKSVVTYYQ